MLSFRNRSDRSSGGSWEYRHPLITPEAVFSSLRDRTPRADADNSLRSRFKSLTGNFTRRSIPGLTKSRISYEPNPWYREKSDNDLLGSASVQHVEIAGQTWPTIRKSISSMASSLRTRRGATDSSRSTDDASQQTLPCHSKAGFRVSQENTKQRVTIETHTPFVASKHCAAGAGYSSSSAASEVVPRHRQESVPRLPSLATPSNFLESLNKTGLFRRLTPSSCIPSPECNDTVEPIKVQREISVGSKSSAMGNKLSEKQGSLGRAQPSAINTTEASSQTSSDTNHNTHHNTHRPHRTYSQQEQLQTSYLSRLPVEWLDCILETSFVTRDPILLTMPSTQATAEAQIAREGSSQRQNYIFVDVQQHLAPPGPLSRYAGLKRALEDICDNFGHLYAPFAAYNAHTQTITLFPRGTPRPANPFLDEDTKLFELQRARSAVSDAERRCLLPSILFSVVQV
ncbi:hypothetical protein GGR50DRAFT_616006 [Xylaria sp. CBS 124048]|nr:hypothetical protein GGR50DRAFT_616006 [Xylaria sp. CBS 124048]